ncbi:exonuclease 1-like [Montipora foliosa]|uniref:exonuclease 1-like n=1 Tax=Montipora foliosa TaxID=591990 RepID=UPI0035F1E244
MSHKLLKVLYKVHLHGSCQSIQSKDIPKCLNISNYTFDLFRHMCIIAGCDYLESLPGIGIKRAHNLMTKVAAANGDVRKFFSRLPQVLGVKSLRVLGPEYLLRFDEADQMFLHQVVFDPRNLRAVPLNPILDESEAPPELYPCLLSFLYMVQTVYGDPEHCFIWNVMVNQMTQLRILIMSSQTYTKTPAVA